MRGPVVRVLAGVLLVGACGGGADGESETSGAPTTDRPGEALVTGTSMTIAATAGAEPIATGTVLKGSTLGGAPFCVGGTILDSHGSPDPAVKPYGLIDRTITCPNGTVRVGFTPEEPQGETQTGSWRIVSGTGVFENLRGRGKMTITYDPDDEAFGRETLTGRVTGGPG